LSEQDEEFLYSLWGFPGCLITYHQGRDLDRSQQKPLSGDHQIQHNTTPRFKMAPKHTDSK
jgi:hypothetical protein